MSLEIEINNGIKQAMLGKEKVRLAALRAIKAEILLAKILPTRILIKFLTQIILLMP